MIRQYHNVWIRVAGIAKRIRKGLKPPHWRFQVVGHNDQYLIMGWTLVGRANPHNNTQGVNPEATGQEFLAWVEYYGDIEINENDHATITLKTPELQ